MHQIRFAPGIRTGPLWGAHDSQILLVGCGGDIPIPLPFDVRFLTIGELLGGGLRCPSDRVVFIVAFYCLLFILLQISLNIANLAFLQKLYC